MAKNQRVVIYGMGYLVAATIILTVTYFAADLRIVAALTMLFLAVAEIIVLRMMFHKWHMWHRLPIAFTATFALVEGGAHLLAHLNYVEPGGAVLMTAQRMRDFGFLALSAFAIAAAQVHGKQYTKKENK